MCLTKYKTMKTRGKIRDKKAYITTNKRTKEKEAVINWCIYDKKLQELDNKQLAFHYYITRKK